MVLCFFINYFCFDSILNASEVVITYGLHPFDICSKNPDLWSFIKVTFIISSAFVFFVLGFIIYGFLSKVYNQYFSTFKHHLDDLDSTSESALNLVIGKNEDNRIYYKYF